MGGKNKTFGKNLIMLIGACTEKTHHGYDPGKVRTILSRFVPSIVVDGGEAWDPVRRREDYRCEKNVVIREREGEQ